MRDVAAVLFLLLSAAMFTASAAATSDYEVGPRPWMVGMEWQWESDDTTKDSRVHDHKELATPNGRYDVWITHERKGSDDGTLVLSSKLWVQGSLRLAHEQHTVYRTGVDPVTITRSYDPPVPYPFWETLRPGKVVSEDVTITTSTMVGTTPTGTESQDYRWVAHAGEEVQEVATPAGTFDAYPVDIYKRPTEGDNVTRYSFVYAPEVRNFLATKDGGELDLQLTKYILKPPPVPRPSFSPALPAVDENVTLDGSHSYDPDGEVVAYNWTLADGTVLQGATVNTSFPRSGTHRIVLTVTDDAGQSRSSPMQVRVAEAQPQVDLVGPAITSAGTPTEFRLIPPEDRTIARATWSAPGVEERTGDTAELVFPQAGSYTVSVTFVDNEGTTGQRTHRIQVFEDGGSRNQAQQSDGQPTDGPQGLAPTVPTILSPENGTRLATDEVLVVARVAGLEDPVLLLGNNLRVPLTSQAGLATAQVPLSGETTVLRLLDGEHVIDTITLIKDPGAGDVQSSGNASTGVRGTPAPTPLAPLLILIPLLRRREP